MINFCEVFRFLLELKGVVSHTEAFSTPSWLFAALLHFSSLPELNLNISLNLFLQITKESSGVESFTALPRSADYRTFKKTLKHFYQKIHFTIFRRNRKSYEGSNLTIVYYFLCLLLFSDFMQYANPPDVPYRASLRTSHHRVRLPPILFYLCGYTMCMLSHKKWSELEHWGIGHLKIRPRCPGGREYNMK